MLIAALRASIAKGEKKKIIERVIILNGFLNKTAPFQFDFNIYASFLQIRLLTSLEIAKLGTKIKV